MRLTKDMQYALHVTKFKKRLKYSELSKEIGITPKTLIKIINADLDDEKIRFSHTTIFKVSNYLAKQHTL